MANADLTAQRLRERLDYNPATGRFKWLPRDESSFGSARAFSVWLSRYCGEEAGCLRPSGYVKIRIDGHLHGAHRLAWLHAYGEHPKHQIDHINGNRADNRLENLRDVPIQINSQNQRRAQKRNTTGFLGVSRNGDRFVALITVGGKSRYLGSFDTPEQAHEEYISAKRLLHKGCTL